MITIVLFLTYLYKKIKSEKVNHEYSTVTVFSNGFQYPVLLLNEAAIHKSHGNPQCA